MSQPQFTGRVAIVTGASSGIGKAVALALANEGASVVATYNSNKAGADALEEDASTSEGSIETVRTDVCSAKDVQRMVDHTLEIFGGRLDVLVNNAGQWMDKSPIAECPDELWDHMINVNLKSVFLCCRAAIPAMQKHGGGAIVNISSVAGHTGGGGAPCPTARRRAGSTPSPVDSQKSLPRTASGSTRWRPALSTPRCSTGTPHPNSSIPSGGPHL